MNEKQTDNAIRPTKKQSELLAFIGKFIDGHGYSPSYREIMAGLNYTSVATVALHVNSLINRGHLRKRDHSARSLEVVNGGSLPSVKTNQVTPREEKWLVDKVEYAFSKAETATGTITTDQLVTLIEALRVLGLEGAAQSFVPRLASLRKNQTVEGQKLSLRAEA
jgi:SOS-response transcriptional repressor LexA